MHEETSSRELGERAVEISSIPGERIPGALLSALVAFGILLKERRNLHLSPIRWRYEKTRLG